MVVVKVRETYDLHTIQNKMTVIAIHTPKPEILKRNYPGLLMQCKAYRPVSCDVRLACASMLPLDPLGVGTEAGDVSPEDVFNPILYKATSNFGMSQLEARLAAMVTNSTAAGTADIQGKIADVDVDSFTELADDFNLYYGLLADTHGWKHAHPQKGLSMEGLKPLVWELLYNIGDNVDQDSVAGGRFAAPKADNAAASYVPQAIRGNAKPMPFINCTSYSYTQAGTGEAAAGFPNLPWSAEVNVPYLNVVCGAIIVPPSRLHSLYFRLVCEWSIEFSMIRPLSDILQFGGVADLGANTHYQNYNYENTKEAITGDSSTILEKDTCMLASNVDVNKVM